MDGDAAGFGALLRRHRGTAGMTQEALAEKSGLSVREIRRLERSGGHRPRPTTVGYLAKALGLSEPERLLFEEAAWEISRDATSKSSHSSPRGDLAEPLTPLVGRERLVAEAVVLLRREDVRLLTLTGSGGVGKTCVGLKVAEELRPSYAHGAVLVGLEAVNEPALVMAPIARVLGLRDDSMDRTLPERLQRYLRDKEMLLFLDNFEQVNRAAPLLVRLLVGCPKLKILVTSRAALHVRGEQELEVPPLGVPSPEETDPAVLIEYPAVAIFVGRAQAADPAFSLTEDNARAVAGICRRLDGLPLAIELTAARSKLLPPNILLNRLDRGLGLISGGGPDLPDRHRTLRDAIAWSYDLLGEDEKTLFRRLSVFSGGCTLEAAGAVCALAHAPHHKMERRPDVLDGVIALADASLLRADQSRGGGLRFGMLETVREFARELLAASGGEAETRNRHAAFFLDLAEGAEPHLLGPAQTAWMDLLEEEHHNLRAALVWARESAEAEMGLRLSASLCIFWWTRGHLSEGREWIEYFLRDASQKGRRWMLYLPRTLVGAGLLADGQGYHDRAATLYEEGLRLYRELGDERGAAFALANLGQATRARGDHDRAEALSEEGLALSRKNGEHLSAAVALNTLGHVARRRGDHGRAEALYGESLAAFRASGDERGAAYTLGNLGTTALERGEAGRALALQEESLRIYEGLKDKAGRAFALINLGDATRAKGHEDRAVALYEESLAMHRELGNEKGVVRALERLAAISDGDPKPDGGRDS